ncbi:MAG: septum site-determining protein [Rhizobacter sp.]|nr:septum site-determining protein [Rhizobacter sp.]
MSALPPNPPGSDADDDNDRTIIRPSSRTSPASGAADREAGVSTAASPVPSPTQPRPDAIGAAVAASVADTAAAAAERDENALAAGTVLGEFEITEVLGIGGFGIVYLAIDHSLHRKVAVKEYMPTALAARQGPTEVRVKSPRHRDTFDAGLKSFVNEARLLAQFDHPALVKVYRFWEAHGTAYMVMPFYEGVTLKDTLAAMGEPPSEAWLRNLLAPLTEALQVIHSEQCFHRDIAPDNVILLKGSNRPLLLDFGAARRVIGDMTQALTVILKPGYAPLEQYAEVPGMKQGAWTDVYALCAVVYYAIVGKTPPTSVGRLVNDNYVPLAEQRPGQYSDRFLRAVDHGLVVRPEERTQSIEALRSDLGLSATRFDPDITQQVELSAAPPLARPGDAAARPGMTTSPTTSTSSASPLAASSSTAGSSTPTRSRTPLVAGIAVVVLAAAGYLAFSVMAPHSRAPGAPSVADVAAPGTLAVAPASSPIASTDATRAPAPTPPAAVTASPRVAEATTSAAPAPLPASLPATAPASPPPVTAAAPRSGPLDPTYEFDRIVQGRTVGFGVTATPARPTVRIDHDRLSFKVTSTRDGFVYVLLKSTEGAFMLLLPNDHARGNAIKAGQALGLPPASWPLDVAGPPGTDEFLVIVSASPRDFSATGMKSEQGIGHFANRPTSAAAASPYAGEPRCKAGEACSADYGAARFSVVESR